MRQGRGLGTERPPTACRGHPWLPACSVFQCMHTDFIRIRCQAHLGASMAKDAAISVRLQEEVKKAAEKAAQDDSRSLASLVEKVLREWLKANGYLGSAKSQQGRTSARG